MVRSNAGSRRRRAVAASSLLSLALLAQSTTAEADGIDDAAAAAAAPRRPHGSSTYGTSSAPLPVHRRAAECENGIDDDDEEDGDASCRADVDDDDDETPPVYFGRDSDERCAQWASEAGRCRSERTVLLSECPRSCAEIAGVSVRTLTGEEVFADAVGGFAFIFEAGDDDGDRDEDEPCGDENEQCKTWADQGECLANPGYMLAKCRESCLACLGLGKEALTTTIDFGVEQQHVGEHIDVEGGGADSWADLTLESLAKDEVANIIVDTYEYMVDEVFVDPKYEKVRRDCRNLDPDCSLLAARGGCVGANKVWMQRNCAPACRTCLAVDFWRRCGVGPEDVDSMKPGELDAMFERIRDEYPQYSPTVLSQPSNNNQDQDGSATEDGGPWVMTLENFLTDEECDFLIGKGHDLGYERSTHGGGGERSVSDKRTSAHTWCQNKCEDHPTTQKIVRRIADMTGFPEENFEHLQLLKYEVGQYYGKHHDADLSGQEHISCGHRVLTFFLYLNDVEEGGETRLNNLGLDIAPRKGMALLWPSVLNEDLNEADSRTHHEAMPVKRGVKYGANAWIHLRPFKPVMDCFILKASLQL